LAVKRRIQAVRGNLARWWAGFMDLVKSREA
jgi:hypothetical protein